MNANLRGLIIFIILVAASVFFCGTFPYSVLPNAGMGFALPVIQVPGEVYAAGWPSENFEFTNTLMGTLLADVLVILLAIFAFRASKGWRNEVPGRFQGMVEAIVEFVYGQVKGMAGTAAVVRRQLFPLVGSILLFLLLANWLELIPGVDSIGLMHCAHPGMNGYARNGNALYNDQALFGGAPVTSEHQFEVCELYLEGHTAPGANLSAEELNAEKVTAMEAIATAEAAENTEEAEHLKLELAALELRLEAVPEFASLDGTVDEEAIAAIEAKVAAGTELTEEEQAALEHAEEYQLAKTRMRYPGALYALSDEQLAEGKIQPYGFVVTPFVRAAATDMNLTFGLALISVVAMQYFGVAALGLGYFQKFININALGNAGKRPMGLMDFGVGLFEIISEISKIISLAFRLFGNIFAGQLLLFIIGFLVATLLPVAIYGLEFIVGAIQAYVFAVLTLVFSAQAMQGHGHGDEEHH